jgi:hypothetical protein
MNIGLRDSQLRMLHNLHKVNYLGKDLCIDFLNKLHFQDIADWSSNP